MKKRTKYLSLLLSLAMVVSICSQIVFFDRAEAISPLAEGEAPWTITEIDQLEETVAAQTIAQLTEGGEEIKPILPDTLDVSAYQVGGRSPNYLS